MPEGDYVVPLGKARLAREGDDVTLVAYGAMVPLCERAADALDGEASVEVLDIRSLKPLDEDALLASAAKTGRVVIVQEAPRTAGFGAELAAILAEKAILDLHGPVLRVTGYDVPYPYWKIEDRVHAVGRARRRCRPEAPRSSDGGGSGSGSSAASRATGCATRRRGDADAWDDRGVRVVKLAGASYRADALQDEAFAPGRRLALVREPENEHDPNAVAVWDAERRLQAGYVPAEVAPELAATSRPSRSGSSATRTAAASACASCSRRRTRGSRSRAREGLVLAATTSRSRPSSRASPVVVPGAERRLALGSGRRPERPRGRTATRCTARSRSAERAPGRRSRCASTRSTPRDWGGTWADGETFDWPLDGDWWRPRRAGASARRRSSA